MGKQIPYVAVAMVNFFALFLMAIFISAFRSRGHSSPCSSPPSSMYSRRPDSVSSFPPSCAPRSPRCSRRRFLDRSGGEVFRIVRAGIVSVGHGEDPRPVVPVGMVSAGHCRRIRQGARLPRPMAQRRRDHHHCAGLSRLVAPPAPQTGGLTYPLFLRRRRRFWPKQNR